MTPRAEALAFRMWSWCRPREWDCTLSEVAEALDESVNRVRGVAHAKGWLGRFRKTTTDGGYHVGMFTNAPAEREVLASMTFAGGAE